MSEVYSCLKAVGERLGERVLWEGYVLQVATQGIAHRVEPLQSIFSLNIPSW